LEYAQQKCNEVKIIKEAREQGDEKQLRQGILDVCLALWVPHMFKSMNLAASRSKNQ
jgi:hypothetical protein